MGTKDTEDVMEDENPPGEYAPCATEETAYPEKGRPASPLGNRYQSYHEMQPFL
jgi:hypothetical protein